MSTLRGRFDYVMLSFCGLLLGFVGDCMITLSAVVAKLVHPKMNLIMDLAMWEEYQVALEGCNSSYLIVLFLS